MIHFHSSSMSYDGHDFKILDQTLLPHQHKWLLCDDADTLVSIIRRLAIRGAPAIGISASILLALLAERGIPRELLLEKARQLLDARPTAVNLKNNIERMASVIKDAELPGAVTAMAEMIYTEDLQLCQKIGSLGAAFIQPGERILTHCNTGSLATAGIGTAMGIITEAHKQHADIFVWVDETRPLLQGGRLTAWECGQAGIDHAVICDSAAAHYMSCGQVDRIFVGSDRIATNGDFANKIGTYSLAVLARYHNIPFYVAAPKTTIDPHCGNGSEIPIEMRSDDEVKGVNGSFGSCSWCPDSSPACNPAFDVTPADLVTAWILDTGVFYKKDLKRKEWWLKAVSP